MKNLSTLFLALVLLTTIACQPKNRGSNTSNYDPPAIQSTALKANKMIGVSLKTGNKNKQLKVTYNDITFGANIQQLTALLNKNKINNIRIGVGKNEPKRNQEAIVKLVQELHDNGAGEIGLILSHRVYNPQKEEAAERYATLVGGVYNALKEKGLSHMVKGAMFGENKRLEGKASTKELWDKRHRGIIFSMSKLNEKTNNAFKKRSVIFIGKGYGAQFKGAQASASEMNFDQEMKKQVYNYIYAFKLFQTGHPSNKKLGFNDWVEHFKNHCGLNEIAAMDVPMIFIGDSGGGIHPGAFDSGNNAYKNGGEHMMPALLSIFKNNNWSGFNINRFIIKKAKKMGKNPIYMILENGDIQKRPEGQLETWLYWRDAF